MEIERSLSYFGKNDEELIFEIVLKNIEISVLQKIFDRPREDVMYDCFKITTKEAVELEKILNIVLDLEKYDIFLECSAI